MREKHQNSLGFNGFLNSTEKTYKIIKKSACFREIDAL